ncbi:L-histidine N(alpha)-methyltransferase [Duganella sp. FT135W]|uniref:L-histidine N(Alpha)-methyltransferase n=1 Tax=Duganella flavida TaxID=2692175 RepID=A0A6L8KDJ2_9BURK|nr:L-histidine N(alpha)-methyltransferase [Duganella flavida]MYM23912.1 L-histidine N(alpha)-methyltransferase [Duganella flavida]
MHMSHGSAAVIAEINAGLLAPAAHISPKFLYDGLGSKLFEAICELPEYYPTRTEASIFAAHGPEMARVVGDGSTLIDLGAGNCAKAASLFPLLHPAQYVPVDISREFLLGAVEQLRQRFPHIEMTALGLDFSSSFTLPDSVRKAHRVFFYPGSSIGNFTPEQAVNFLRSLRSNGGDLLIGADLIKDHEVLDAAYDDALGVTAAFNLNILRHVNHLAGADFEVAQWKHIAYFDFEHSRIEMHVEARCDLTVRWQGGERRFERGQRIHTENSYKYTRQSFATLLERAGFATTHTWTDDEQWFAVFHARTIPD